MKRFISLYIIVLMFGLSAQAQQIMEGTGEVKNLATTRNGKSIKLAMDIDISGLEVGADETLILTPVVEKGSESCELPAVEIMGRRAYIYHLRNDEFTATANPFYAEREAKRAERKAGEKQLVEYATTLEFKEWMRGATVSIKESSCGCKPEVVALGKSNVGNFFHEIYQPQFVWSFAEPQPEPVKVRDERLTAYINFKVDKYDILENFGNNKHELAAMVNSIKKVDDDADLTITSITIEGWASPEATELHNQLLSQNRANSLADYVAKSTGIDRATIEAIGRGEDWAGLRELVVATPGLLDQQKVLAIIDNKELTLDQKDKQLSQLIPPTIYRRLMNEMYPKLRRNDYQIVYKVRNFNIDEARAMINSDPEKLSLGEMYKVAGSYAKGSKEYNHAMEVAAKIYPTVVEAAINAAIIEMEAKQYDRALAILAKSDASDARILSLRGNIYAALGDMGKARVEWTNAAAKGNADAQHNLAELDKHLKSL